MPLFRRRRARRETDELIDRLTDPAQRQFDAELAAMPLDDPGAEQLRGFAEHFAIRDETVIDRLPMFIRAGALVYISDLADMGEVSEAESDKDAAFTTVLWGLGIRVAEHRSGAQPAIVTGHSVRIDLSERDANVAGRQAVAAAHSLFEGDPGPWFAAGKDAWGDLEYKARQTIALATRTGVLGIAAQIPYEELVSFGYALGCAADLVSPGWADT